MIQTAKFIAALTAGASLISALAPITLLTAPAQAADMQDLGAIDRAIAQFTGSAIGENGGARLPLDRQLRLRACAAPLDIDWYGSRGDALAVRCNDAGGWRVFVAIKAVAKTQSRILVQRRDPVRVEVGGAGFSVSRTGEAMETGKAGDWIRVRLKDNSRSGRVVSARIMDDGRVVIPLG